MNRRRKTDLLESAAFAESNPMPEINRAHRDCERECIELRCRVKALELLLDRAGDEIIILASFVDDFAGQPHHAPELIAEIDAILPATEDNKE